MTKPKVAPGADIVPESGRTPLVPENRQEAAILTGNFRDLVDAVVLDEKNSDRLKSIGDRLDSIHLLLGSEETLSAAIKEFEAVDKSIHELETIDLTERERAILAELKIRHIGLGFLFAEPGEGTHPGPSECPA